MSIGGGTLSGRPVKAVQVGGPLGAYFPRALFDTPFGYEEFAGKDGLIGHAGLTVFDDSADMLAQARFAMEFCAIESCGKCTPCRIGAVRGVETVDRIARGDATAHPAADRPVQHDEGRVAVRAGRLYPLSGDVRADPFPRRLCPHERGRRMKDFIIPDRDFGTPAAKSKQMVTLTIDGFAVTVPEGTSIMRAAAEAGIQVPKLCATDSRRCVRVVPAVSGRDRGAERHACVLHHAGVRRG